MKRVIKMSKAWSAAFILGALLTGCGGGGSSESAGTQTGSNDSSGEVSSPQRSAVLSWSAPTDRVNQEALSPYDLDKYVIRYGNEEGNLDQSIVIENAGGLRDMSYEVSGLDAGTWYFTIQVQDTNGLISEPSDVVSKSIRS